MSVLATSLALTLLILSMASDTPVSIKRTDAFVWVCLGGSWTSGVSSSTKTHFDADKFGCHRCNDSYGPFMAQNNTWTTGVQEFDSISLHVSRIDCDALQRQRTLIHYLHAGSGARLSNIAVEPQRANPIQIKNAGKPQIATYHASGNITYAFRYTESKRLLCKTAGFDIVLTYTAQDRTDHLH
jgi:hypothetical protein